MSRPSLVTIDLCALRRNYSHVRRMHGRSVMAVMKANAYGHGAAICAQALHDEADGFAVAFTEEALELRESNIRKPILVLEGCFDIGELKQAAKQQFSIVIHSHDQVRMLESLDLPPNCMDVWIKIDTGMHRLGFDPSNVREIHTRIKGCRSVRNVTLMTHFSRADETTSSFTQQQIRRFDLAAASLGAPTSLSNSAGILAWPEVNDDCARAGLIIYGVSPMTSNQRHAVHEGIHALDPVMTVKSEVIGLQFVPKGEAVGYANGATTRRDSRIGVVAIGYGDGYPRHAPNGTPVLIDGLPAQLIGRVCMDMLMVDLTDLPSSGMGSDVELWGKNLDVNIIARHAGTVSHDLLTGVKRVRKRYEPYHDL